MEIENYSAGFTEDDALMFPLFHAGLCSELLGGLTADEPHIDGIQRNHSTPHLPPEHQ